MTIRTYLPACPKKKDLVHLYNIEHSLVAYGLDIVSFQEHVNTIETEPAVLFVKFDSTSSANLFMTTGAGSSPFIPSNTKFQQKFNPGQHAEIAATTMESINAMNIIYHKASIESVNMQVPNYVLMETMFPDDDEDE